jgi:tetratricopeptide (TPR) repeat protein
MATVPLPSDRRLAAATWSLRERLNSVRFLELAGRYDEGLRRIVMLAEADVAVLSALVAAERADHDMLRAEAMTFRIELKGYLAARAEAVEDWIGQTTALVERVAPNSLLEGILLKNIGLMRYRQGDFERAIEFVERSVQLLGNVLREGDPVFISSLLDLGRSYWRAGRRDEGRLVLTRARSLAERKLGPEHPVLIGIYLNLANINMDEALYRKSLDLATRTFGADHPASALPLGNLGLVYLQRGDSERALDHYSRAAMINRKTLGTHPATAIALANAGDALARLGRAEEALVPLRESLAIYDSLYPDGHPDSLVPLYNLGYVTRRIGQFEVSRNYLLRAREISMKHQASVEFVAVELADTLTDLGAADEALGVLATIETAPELGPILALHRDWIFAKALWLASPVQRAHARTLVEGIAVQLATRLADPAASRDQLESYSEELRDVKAWLAGHEPQHRHPRSPRP